MVRVRAAVSVPPVALGRVGMGNREGKRLKMEGFPLATPDWGVSGGREGVWSVMRVRAAIVAATTGLETSGNGQP